MRPSLLLALVGTLIGAVGVVVAFTLWHVGGIVVMMIGAAVVLVAKALGYSELSARRRAGRPSA